MSVNLASRVHTLILAMTESWEKFHILLYLTLLACTGAREFLNRYRFTTKGATGEQVQHSINVEHMVRAPGHMEQRPKDKRATEENRRVMLKDPYSLTFGSLVATTEYTVDELQVEVAADPKFLNTIPLDILGGGTCLCLSPTVFCSCNTIHTYILQLT